MCPITHTSFLAIAAAVISSFVFGYLWYGPLFGKSWVGLMGIKMDDKKCGKPPASALLLTLFGTFLTTFVLAFILKNYGVDCPFKASFLVWLGFYVPVALGAVTWECKPWALFGLNVSYYFLNLQLIAFILTYVR